MFFCLCRCDVHLNFVKKKNFKLQQYIARIAIYYTHSFSWRDKHAIYRPDVYIYTQSERKLSRARDIDSPLAAWPPIMKCRYCARGAKEGDYIRAGGWAAILTVLHHRRRVSIARRFMPPPLRDLPQGYIYSTH